MCGRYKLTKEDWEFSDLRLLPRFPTVFEGNIDVRPTDAMPVVRTGETGEVFAELRRWGFLRTWPGASGKWVKKQLFNAVGEELEQKRSFRGAWQTSRCVVPMSSWYEWPTIDGKKVKTQIRLRQQRLFGAAGLFEVSTDPKTGDPVPTFTVVTVEPNEMLGTVHDRAPVILLSDADWAAWLDGGPPAKALIHPHADATEFEITPVA